MPKMKTHKGAAKRFRVTAGGKLMREKAFKSHILTKKNAKRKRRLGTDGEVSASDSRKVKRLLGR